MSSLRERMRRGRDKPCAVLKNVCETSWFSRFSDNSDFQVSFVGSGLYLHYGSLFESSGADVLFLFCCVLLGGWIILIFKLGENLPCYMVHTDYSCIDSVISDNYKFADYLSSDHSVSIANRQITDPLNLKGVAHLPGNSLRIVESHGRLWYSGNWTQT